MNNNELAFEIYKRLLEVGINASVKSVSIIEEVLNEERERKGFHFRGAYDKMAEIMSMGLEACDSECEA